ncbi:MAG: hypothetical protein H6R46_367 [Proteobacteria bacterium]|nr:hypothetical protein [Pseudomonadota bacterium]
MENGQQDRKEGWERELLEKLAQGASMGHIF